MEREKGREGSIHHHRHILCTLVYTSNDLLSSGTNTVHQLQQCITSIHLMLAIHHTCITCLLYIIHASIHHTCITCLLYIIHASHLRITSMHPSSQSLLPVEECHSEAHVEEVGTCWSCSGNLSHSQAFVGSYTASGTWALSSTRNHVLIMIMMMHIIQYISHTHHIIYHINITYISHIISHQYHISHITYIS